ncbi:dual specificity protein kinase kns1 [Agyrium rufum]|nr:dual specificity protein kinase kns1 [Agyrium rufum]
MSTPSTATATVPPPHPHYGYSRPTDYASGSPLRYPNDLPTHNSRIVNSYTGYPDLRVPTHQLPRPSATASANHNHASYQQNGSMATSQQPSSVASPALHPPPPQKSANPPARRPDWNDFYKNGPPKEIIVIDDDSPPPPPPKPRPQDAQSNSTMASHHNYCEPASKKRKTGPNYDHVPPRDQPSYSNTNTPHGSNTISTDRTTSLQTTAPTSLGSHGSGGSGSTYVNTSTATGTKRKRVTRQQTSEDKKRREIAEVGDAFNSYIPPPKPPIKAGEVYVQPVKDPHPTNQKVDDDDGHFIVLENSDLTDRYSVSKLLGQGTFGKVVEAYDKRRKTRCAIKIIRSVQKYRDASRIELRVLSTLSQNDKYNRNKCIHLRDCFDYRNHICIVTDLLGMSVFDFLKNNNFVPFPSSQIQNFARQLLTSVAFLHDLNLIHTDLKPENILLVHNQYQTFTYNRQIPTSSTTAQRNARQRKVLLDTEIRLIDFGSATFDDEYHSSVVSTRHYRAPEIILNLGWSFPCDIWSIGCILVEFYTGDALFQTHDNLEHLAMMEKVCASKIDAKLVKQVTTGRSNNNSAAKYFKGTKLDYPGKEASKASKKYVAAMKPLPEIITPINPFNKSFLDLLKKIFQYDQSKRITAKEALKHPWFKESLVDDGTEALRLKREGGLTVR